MLTGKYLALQDGKQENHIDNHGWMGFGQSKRE